MIWCHQNLLKHSKKLFESLYNQKKSISMEILKEVDF